MALLAVFFLSENQIAIKVERRIKSKKTEKKPIKEAGLWHIKPAGAVTVTICSPYIKSPSFYPMAFLALSPVSRPFLPEEILFLDMNPSL